LLTEVASPADLAFDSQTCSHDIPLSIASFQNTGFAGLLSPESMLSSTENAARVKVAISVALIPRTIIAHSFDDIIVIMQPDNICGCLPVACASEEF
jgi:hypothetical protein